LTKSLTTHRYTHQSFVLQAPLAELKYSMQKL